MYEQEGASWSEPALHETNNAPAVSEDVADRLRKNMRQCFSPPPETYGHKALNVSDEEWKARVDLAAAYRLCCHYHLNEGIVNHLTVSPRPVLLAVPRKVQEVVRPDTPWSAPATLPLRHLPQRAQCFR